MKNNQRHAITGEPVDDWRGYDFDQLVYRRAITSARIQIEKSQILGEVNQMRQGSLHFGQTVVKRTLGAMNFMDYIALGIKVWRIARPLFRRRK